VIGNSNYNKKADWLANPLNDAADMAAVLRSLNFKVILKKDIDRTSMERAVNKVAGETNNQQIPWQSGSMKEIFCFSRCGVSEE